MTEDILRYNDGRRLQVLAIMAARPDRLKAHTMVRGKERVSAMIGGICWRCRKTRQEILDCVDGEKCHRSDGI